MKKTEMKKLSLHRETLLFLEDKRRLSGVAGGRTEESCNFSCDPGSSVRVCPTSCLC